MRQAIQVVLAGAVLAVMGGNSARPADADDESDEKPMRTSVSIAEGPTTVRLELPAEAKERLEEFRGDGAPAVRLRLREITIPADILRLKALRIFVGRPCATAETSIKDPHYAGSIVLNPLPKEQSVILDIGKTIDELVSREKLDLRSKVPLAITFVPVSSDPDAETLEGFQLEIEAVEMNAPESTREK